MTAVRRTLWTLLCLTLLRWPVAVLTAALLPDASVAPEVNYAASIAQSLLMFALPGWLLWPKGDEPAPAGRRLPIWLLAGAVCAVLARAAISPLNDWWSALIGADGTAVPVAQGVLAQALQVLALAVVPAVAEEMFFRGALLRSLQTCCGRWAALLLTTLLFALMHGSIAGLPGHLAISLLLTLLMMHSDCIYVPLAAHLIYNLTALFLPEQPPAVSWLCGGMLAALLLLMALRLPRGAGPRMARKDCLLCGAILAVMATQYFV